MKTQSKIFKKNLLISSLVYFVVLELTFFVKQSLNTDSYLLSWHLVLAILSLGLNYLSFYVLLTRINDQKRAKRNWTLTQIFFGFPILIWTLTIGVLILLTSGYSGQLWILISSTIWTVFLAALLRSVQNAYSVSKYIKLIDFVAVYIFFAGILLVGYFLKDLTFGAVLIVYLIMIFATFKLELLTKPFFYIINLLAIFVMYMVFLFIDHQSKLLFFREALFFTNIFFLFSSVLRLIELGRFKKDNIFQTIIAFLVVAIVTLGG
ncbi:hypothetical protein JW962_03795 [Candidatus Dojkabacteria bacterium]|nr:hypothetical protein [Candidatus Dojkabacteria bacterium]